MSNEMELMEMAQTDQTRRTFMRALGCGGVGAAVALLGAKPAVAAEKEAAVTEAPQPNKGYRLSAHVQTYYDKARI